MHELSICQSIVEVVGRHAAGRRVEAVRLRVGHLRQVVPSTLGYCWELVVAGTPLDGCRLDLVEVPAQVRCRSCTAVTELTEPHFRCGGCGSPDVEVMAGEELLVESLELAGVRTKGSASCAK